MKVNESSQAAVDGVNAFIAPVLAFIMAVMRSEYQGRQRSRKKVILEGLILGMATAALWPQIFSIALKIEFLNIAPADKLSFSIFVGVTFGFMGVDALSAWLHKYFEKKQMKILQWLFRAFLAFCFLAVVGVICGAGWLVYLAWWIVEGMRQWCILIRYVQRYASALQKAKAWFLFVQAKECQAKHLFIVG